MGVPAVPGNIRQAALDAIASVLDRDVESYSTDLAPMQAQGEGTNVIIMGRSPRAPVTPAGCVGCCLVVPAQVHRLMAAPKNRIHLSRFPAVKKGMYEAVQNARDRALDEGEAEAEKRLERVNDQRGYNLPTKSSRKTGHQSGLIRYGDWFGKFFEYGTVYIAPSPFMRPAHRKMRKRFLDEMDGNVEKFIRRKVGRVR